MTDVQNKLDQELREFLSGKDDGDLFDFCAGLTPQYPVCIDLKHCVEGTVDYLENAMILFSGFSSESFAPLAAASKRMVAQEIASGRWESMPSDEREAAGIIAQRSFDDLSKSAAPLDDPDKVYMVIGLYAYAAVCCNEGLDGMSFLRLFVLGWLIYFSEKLSVPAAVKRNANAVES